MLCCDLFQGVVLREGINILHWLLCCDLFEGGFSLYWLWSCDLFQGGFSLYWLTLLCCDLFEGGFSLHWLLCCDLFQGGFSLHWSLCCDLFQGWCGWKAANFWNPTAHYNLCMPMRPSCFWAWSKRSQRTQRVMLQFRTEENCCLLPLGQVIICTQKLGGVTDQSGSLFARCKPQLNCTSKSALHFLVQTVHEECTLKNWTANSVPMKTRLMTHLPSSCCNSFILHLTQLCLDPVIACKI